MLVRTVGASEQVKDAQRTKCIPGCAAHDTNNQIMDTAVNHAEKSTVLSVILPFAFEDCFKLAGEAVVYTNKCLQGMGSKHIAQSVNGLEEDMVALVQALARQLFGKPNECKKASIQGLMRQVLSGSK